MVDRVADIWGLGAPHPQGSVWPARVDLHLDAGLTADTGPATVPDRC